MVTGTVCPCAPLFGLTVEMLAFGLIVRDAVFELEKAPPVDVVPETDTLYAVGTETATEAGIVNVMRRVVPTIVVTVVAGVLTDAPPAAGAKVTVTFAGGIVPEGKFEPVT